jgi:hypothetical protein
MGMFFAVISIQAKSSAWWIGVMPSLMNPRLGCANACMKQRCEFDRWFARSTVSFAYATGRMLVASGRFGSAVRRLTVVEESRNISLK